MDWCDTLGINIMIKLNKEPLRLLFLFIFSAVLVGCNSGNNAVYSEAQSANQRWVQQGDSCEKKYDKYNPKQAVAWANCQRVAYSNFVSYDQNKDLISLLLTKYLVIAEKFEKGKISSSEYALANQETAVEIQNMITARNNANSMAYSQQQMASAARAQQFYNMQRMLNQNTSTPTVAPTPLPVLPTVRQPVNTNCIGSGNTVNCTSY